MFVEIDSVSKRRIKICILIVSLVFIFSIARGYISARNLPMRGIEQARDIFGSFSFVKDFNTLVIFLFIFLNNAIKALLVILTGIIFGVVPILFVFINGQVLGLVTSAFQEEVGLKVIIAALVPHAILEIPAIILSAAYGLWLGYVFYRRLRFGEIFAAHFKWAMHGFFYLIVPLFFVAALIETFLTPSIATFFR